MKQNRIIYNHVMICYTFFERMMGMDTFGKRLCVLRSESGLSQEDFGKKIGLSRNSIYNYENEKRTPCLEDLVKIAEYFQVSYDYLLCKSDNKRRENTDIGERLGLSDKAIEKLMHDWRKDRLLLGENRREALKSRSGITNMLLEDELYGLFQLYILKHLNAVALVENAPDPDDSVSGGAEKEQTDEIEYALKGRVLLSLRDSAGYYLMEALGRIKDITDKKRGQLFSEPAPIPAEASPEENVP